MKEVIDCGCVPLDARRAEYIVFRKSTDDNSTEKVNEEKTRKQNLYRYIEKEGESPINRHTFTFPLVRK